MYIQPKDLSHETWLLFAILERIICGISLQDAICEVWANIIYNVWFFQ